MDLSCFSQLREKLVALAYLQGEKDYAPVARELLTRAVETEIEKLDEGRRREFNQVLENVHAATVIRLQKRQERARRVSLHDLLSKSEVDN